MCFWNLLLCKGGSYDFWELAILWERMQPSCLCACMHALLSCMCLLVLTQPNLFQRHLPTKFLLGFKQVYWLFAASLLPCVCGVPAGHCWFPVSGTRRSIGYSHSLWEQVIKLPMTIKKKVIVICGPECALFSVLLHSNRSKWIEHLDLGPVRSALWISRSH